MQLETFLRMHDASVSIVAHPQGFVASIITFHWPRGERLEVEWFYTLPETPFPTMEQALDHLRHQVEKVGADLVLLEVQAQLWSLMEGAVQDYRLEDQDFESLARIAAMMPVERRSPALETLQAGLQERLPDQQEMVLVVFERFQAAFKHRLEHP